MIYLINENWDAEVSQNISGKVGSKSQKAQTEQLLVRVGKMTINLFDNELVMQPKAIMVTKRPVREDTAAEKWVELYLHITMSSMDALTETGETVS